MVMISEISGGGSSDMGKLGDLAQTDSVRVVNAETSRAQLPVRTQLTFRPQIDAAKADAIVQAAPQSAAIYLQKPTPELPVVMTPGSMVSGFFDNLMNAVKKQPALFAVGAVAVVAAFIFVPRFLKGMKLPGQKLEPVQVMGLGEHKPKRKKRKSKTSPKA